MQAGTKELKVNNLLWMKNNIVQHRNTFTHTKGTSHNSLTDFHSWDLVSHQEFQAISDYKRLSLFQAQSYILFKDYLLHSHNILLAFLLFWCYVSRATRSTYFVVFCMIH